MQRSVICKRRSRLRLTARISAAISRRSPAWFYADFNLWKHNTETVDIKSVNFEFFRVALRERIDNFFGSRRERSVVSIAAQSRARNISRRKKAPFAPRIFVNFDCVIFRARNFWNIKNYFAAARNIGEIFLYDVNILFPLFIIKTFVSLPNIFLFGGRSLIFRRRIPCYVASKKMYPPPITA